MTPRPRILVFNQYYWPGVEATARLLTQLCEDFAADFDVTVVTGCLRGIAERPERVSQKGVSIIRVPSSFFDRRMVAPRALNYLSFLASSFWVGLRVPRPDVVVCMTDPPIIANLALPVARHYKAPFVIITQDVFPEIAVQLGRLEQPVVIAALRQAIGYALQRADAVVAIGETMRERLEAKGAAADRITVIPNWADTSQIEPMPRENAWAKAQGLSGRFVVMHSGNVGYAQDLDTFVRAATLLRDLDDLAVLVIGTGARLRTLTELAERVEADSVRFLPYQPAEVVSQSLSSADVHFVGLASGLAGYVVPSRLYGILAAGRPVIVSAEAESESARLVSAVGCGVVIPPNRVDLAALTIRAMHDGKYDLEQMGRKGYEYVRKEANRDVAVSRYRELLVELAGRN